MRHVMLNDKKAYCTFLHLSCSVLQKWQKVTRQDHPEQDQRHCQAFGHGKVPFQSNEIWSYGSIYWLKFRVPVPLSYWCVSSWLRELTAGSRGVPTSKCCPSVTNEPRQERFQGWLRVALFGTNNRSCMYFLCVKSGQNLQERTSQRMLDGKMVQSKRREKRDKEKRRRKGLDESEKKQHERESKTEMKG